VQDTSGQSVKVGIVGGSGYTGAELLRLLTLHPFAQVVSITSRQYAGRPVVELFPHLLKSPYEGMVFEEFNAEEIAGKCDVVFSCLPHKASHPVVKELLQANPNLKVIDFSADFRFKSPESYERVYGVSHGAKELFKEAVYGLPELFREEIRGKRLVANPGCYPTSIILGLYPAVKEGLLEVEHPIIADSKSGVSGAGRKASVDFTFCEVNESFRAYGVKGHRHAPEVMEKLNLPYFRFTPHLVPMNRGILSTIYFKPKASLDRILEAYRAVYSSEFFIRLRGAPPKTSEVAGSNFCDIYVTQDSSTGLIVVISAIDNLGKGASAQAVQNMNILFNLPEKTGLELFSWWI